MVPGVIGALVLLVLAAGYFIPSTFSVQRSEVINAPPRKIYNAVVEPKQWAKHYLTLVMDRRVGPDFEAGLRNLKALAEKP